MALGERALCACYARLERPLYNVLYRQLWHREECQDLIHDAFLRVWARRRQVDEGRLEALVWTTALNLARNRLRWHRLWRRVPLDEVMPEAGDAEDDFLARRQVRAALRQLPARQREVLLLSRFAGLDSKQMAAVLGVPAGTVASRKHAAMRQLKALLEEQHVDA